MADILELIKSRRTVKNFLPKYVPWDDIAKCIDAARHAPSSGNIQSWKFILMLEPELKQKVAEACYEQYEISNAAVLVIVCAEIEKAERYYGLRGERLYAIQNCAAAIENMLLEAHSLGLGGRWIGAFDEDAIKALCGIPEEVRPQAIIAIGYPKDVPNKPPKYPLEMQTYFHRWRRRMRDPAKYMRDFSTIIGRKTERLKNLVKETIPFVVDKIKEEPEKEPPRKL